MSKHIGLTDHKRKQREERRGMGQTFIDELKGRFNELGKVVDDMWKLTVTDIGRLSANQTMLVESMDRIDLNVLALAELNKTLYRRLYGSLLGQPGMTEEELDAKTAESYKEDIKKAFAVVSERRRAADEARKVAEEAALASQKEAEEAKLEAEKIEAVLLSAEREKVEPIGVGGPGVDIPEGAQVFGGE